MLGALLLAPTPPPVCQTCPDGVGLVIVHVDGPNAGWQADESHAALDAAMWMAPPAGWRASVVTYNDGGASVLESRASDAGRVRSTLDNMRFNYSIRGHARAAAALALQEVEAMGRTPCRVVVFYAYTKSHVATMRAELLGAAAVLDRARVPVIVACPMDPERWYCRGPEPEMAREARRFVVFPDSGVIAAEVMNALRDTDRGRPVVACVTATPTPTATPWPTPTATRTATSTARPTATPAPSATSSPTAPPVFTAYLPMAASERCQGVRARADVALVLDMSTSMQRRTSAGRAKADAARDAAWLFVGLLQHGDRAAVVGFNNTAWLEQGLTADRQAAQAALARLPGRMAEGTRLDLAIIQGASTGAGVVVLLTDGLPNHVPFPPGGRQEDTVLSAARAAKAAGARLYTIGLGSPGDVLDDLLREVASSPGDAYDAPDGEDLAGIYRQIASRVVGCGGP